MSAARKAWGRGYLRTDRVEIERENEAYFRYRRLSIREPQHPDFLHLPSMGMTSRRMHLVQILLLALALAQGLQLPASGLLRRPSRLCASAGGGFGNKAKKTSPATAATTGGASKGKQPPAPQPSPPSPAFTLQKAGTGQSARTHHLPSFNPSYPGIRCVHSDPPVFEIDDFFSEAQCAEYEALTAADGAVKMQSQTYSSMSTRTSTTW